MHHGPARRRTGGPILGESRHEVRRCRGLIQGDQPLLRVGCRVEGAVMRRGAGRYDVAMLSVMGVETGEVAGGNR